MWGRLSTPAPSKDSFKEAPDFAVVSVATAIRMGEDVCEEARIILRAVAPATYRAKDAEDAIRGKSLNENRIEEAAEAALFHAKPLTRNAYKIEIAKTLVQRALSSASSQERC